MNPEPESKPMFHLIKRGYYYRVNIAGYTSLTSEAGQYTEKDADFHISSSHGEVSKLPVVPSELDLLKIKYETEKALAQKTIALYQKNWAEGQDIIHRCGSEIADLKERLAPFIDTTKGIGAYIDSVVKARQEAESAMAASRQDNEQVMRKLAVMTNSNREQTQSAVRWRRELKQAHEGLTRRDHELGELRASLKTMQCKLLDHAEDSALLDAVETNFWSVEENDRAGGWIVQERGQVCGNIGRGRTPRIAIKAAIGSLSKPSTEVAS